MDEWICLHCLVVELCDICHSSTYTLFTHTYIYYIYICIYLCNLILYSSFSDSFNGFFCNFFLIYLNILCVVMVSIQWWWWLYWCLCKWKYLVRHDCSSNYSGHIYIYCWSSYELVIWSLLFWGEKECECLFILFALSSISITLYNVNNIISKHSFTLCNIFSSNIEWTIIN